MTNLFLATLRKDVDCTSNEFFKGSIKESMFTDCSSVNTNQIQNINKHFKLIRLHMFIGGGNRNYS